MKPLDSGRLTGLASSVVLLFFFVFVLTSSVIAGTIQGTVLNERDGVPLVGVRITFSPSGIHVQTNRHGQFSIEIPTDAKGMLTASLFGYELSHCELTGNMGRDSVVIFKLHETVFPIDGVVTTATRVASSVERVPFSVDVVGMNDLRFASASNGGELLAGIPGLQLKTLGGFGDTQTLSIRGSTAGQVLVLVDGQRMNDMQTGQVNLSTIDLTSVQRVEVVRGGASAIYGPDAVGGVVNFITHDPSFDQATGFRVVAGGGSNGYRSILAGGRYAVDNLWLNVSFQHQQSANDFLYSAFDGSQRRRTNADAKSNAGTVQGGVRLNDAGGSIRALVQYLSLLSGDPGAVTWLTPVARKDYDNFMANVSIEQPFGVHVLSLQSHFQAFRFRYDDPSAYVPIANDSKNRSVGVEVRDLMTVSEEATLTAGGCVAGDQFTGNALDGPHSRRTLGLYAQGDVESRASRDGGGIDYSIVPAIRWDHFSDFDGRVSPRVGLVASTGNPIRFSVKANGGMSYRAPAFNDLYWPRDLFTVGNPSLLPEHSRDADLGLLVRTSSGVRFNAGATLFVKDVHDYILWQADDDGLWSPANVGSAAIHGIEGEIGCEPAPGILFMNWSYTRLNAVDRSASALENGKQLAYQPKDQLTAILHCTINRLDLQAEWRYTSRRFIDAANTKSLDAFHTTDVTARYTFPVSGMSFSAMIAVRNIEGVAYQTNDGYPVPGRELRCTIGIEE